MADWPFGPGDHRFASGFVLRHQHPYVAEHVWLNSALYVSEPEKFVRQFFRKSTTSRDQSRMLVAIAERMIADSVFSERLRRCLSGVRAFQLELTHTEAEFLLYAFRTGYSGRTLPPSLVKALELAVPASMQAPLAALTVSESAKPESGKTAKRGFVGEEPLVGLPPEAVDAMRRIPAAGATPTFRKKYWADLREIPPAALKTSLHSLGVKLREYELAPETIRSIAVFIELAGYHPELVAGLAEFLDAALSDSGKGTVASPKLASETVTALTRIATLEAFAAISLRRVAPHSRAFVRELAIASAAIARKWEVPERELEEVSRPIEGPGVVRRYLQLLETDLTDQHSLSTRIVREVVLAHPLTGELAAKMVYSTAGKSFVFAPDPVDVLGRPVQLEPETPVTLWHPVSTGIGDIELWRDWILAQSWDQPIRQVFREVYLLTDAERNTSPISRRFTGHALRLRQLLVLARQKGWVADRFFRSLTLAGPIHAVLQLRVPVGPSGGWPPEVVEVENHVYTDQTGQPLPIESVPTVFLSESMRHIDFFVSVATVSNYEESWEPESFATPSKGIEDRAGYFKELLPKLGLAGRFRFEGEYLFLHGKRYLYKIHVRTGHIYTGGDTYLCVVPGAPQKSGFDRYLPLQGGFMTSLILSKILLLAEDDQISDPVILQQFRLYENRRSRDQRQSSAEE